VLDDGGYKYVYGLGLAYAVDSLGNTLTQHTDGLGSVRAETDTSGNVVQTYGTDEFGIVDAALTSGTQPTPFQYTGEPRDSETGLVYLRARSYDPTVGRFMQADPFRKTAPGLGGWNRYSYVGNNPVGFVDHSGLCGNQACAQQIAGADLNPCNEQQASLLKAIICEIVVDPPRRPFPSADPNDPRIRVYRVEHNANTRVYIDPEGNVGIDISVPYSMRDVPLFLNFGQSQRAADLYQRRVDQGYRDVSIKSFTVPVAVLESIREEAIDAVNGNCQRGGRACRVDPDIPNQFGIWPSGVAQLSLAIDQGSGQVEKP